MATGDYVLDLSVIAPLFFTGPNLSAYQKVHIGNVIVNNVQNTGNMIVNNVQNTSNMIANNVQNTLRVHTHTHTHTHTHSSWAGFMSLGQPVWPKARLVIQKLLSKDE